MKCFPVHIMAALAATIQLAAASWQLYVFETDVECPETPGAVLFEGVSPQGCANFGEYSPLSFIYEANAGELLELYFAENCDIAQTKQVFAGEDDRCFSVLEGGLKALSWAIIAPTLQRGWAGEGEGKLVEGGWYRSNTKG